MKKLIYIVSFVLCALFNASAQTALPDSTKAKLDALFGTKLLKPVLEQKEKLSAGDFSRAYSTTAYVYDIYKNPEGKDNFYVCVFKEMKGAFITEKVEFRADLKKQTILMYNEKTKKYIAVDEWLKMHDVKKE